MGGPTGHGQRNKPHKAGRTAGLSARAKHRQGKEGGAAPRQAAKSGAQGGKLERVAAAKQHRDAKRQELLEQRRKAVAPVVVALLPLSQAIDVRQLWNSLLSSCASMGQAPKPSGDDKQDASMEVEAEAGPSTSGSTSFPLSMTTMNIAGKGRGTRLTLLPPLANRGDLLSIVDLGKAAEVLVLAVPGGEHQDAIDADGKAALSVLRALGMPGIVVAVQGGVTTAGSMKERSAAKKKAEKAVFAEVAGDHKVFHVDTALDCQQLMRHLSDSTPSVPVWRQQRPALLVEAADFKPDEASSSSQEQQTGTLVLTGYVRYAGLSANQLIHVPGAGDFQIDRIEGLPAHPSGHARGQGAGDMDMTGSAPVLLAQHDPDEREGLERENIPDGDEGEQTWPSEQELLDVEKLVKGKARRRRLPAGTSEYQAAWILDDEDEGDDEDDEDAEGDMAMDAHGSEGGDDDAPDLVDDEEGEDDGLGAMEEDDAEKSAALHEELRNRHRMRQEKEQEEEENPDEVEVPIDVPARTRFQKYRGLKSFRSSPWDPKEWLPQEYSRIFAFENFKRAHKRAKAAVERATGDLDPCAVAPGALVVVHIVGVPADAAAAIIQRVQACMAVDQAGNSSGVPLVAFGLMMHEAKLSVLHAGIKKASTYQAPIANKEQLLLVTGVRTFLAQPIFSADSPGDKQKMERFLHAGRHAVASVIAPISYGPLPLLAFKLPEAAADGGLQGQGQARYAGASLAATGSIRSCDPDRIVLKKITLTGYPVRVHKRKATIRFMFHNPDDIRWFRPVELYTKYGRRGRITEPIGTHGAMKCLFDAPVQQRDAVCMSLFKRAFPKWPQGSMVFA